jgi:hypothetical protein
MAVVVSNLNGLVDAKHETTRRFAGVGREMSGLVGGFSIIEFVRGGDTPIVELGVIGWAQTQDEAKAFAQGFDHGVRRADETRDADAADRQPADQ